MAGLAAHLALNAVLRKPWNSAWGLLAPFACGLALESYEIWIHYRDRGGQAAFIGDLAGIVARHLMDLLLMCFLPVLAVLIGVLSARTG